MSLPVTEDTPPDMLAGSMDLNVVLPNGRTDKMKVLRSTPMMDLLVQTTTAHCLSPGDYSLQAMGDKGVLPFKPNTPIGALDTFTVKIVQKKLNSRGRAPQVPQSFLNTFRLQVHLPRSQLFVLRVTPYVTLSDVMTQVCTEKNLNLEKYEFRNPANLDEVLDLDKTLGDYKLQELSMVCKSNKAITGLMSSADIIKVKSSNRQNSVCDSSLSSGSFGSRSASPVPPISATTMPPQPPIRKKRRPAPKPPVNKEKKNQTSSSVLISHSRESSDSSGYHEASVLSESPIQGGPGGRIGDSPPDTLPRRSKLPPSQSFTNLTSIQPAPKSRLTNSVSNTSLNSNGCSRKKRAPPPPPALILKESKMKSSTLPTSVTEERRNCSSFTTDTAFRHSVVDDDPVDATNTKVQSPVDHTSKVVNETKASKNEVPSALDVGAKIPPMPKPRTVLSSPESTKIHVQRFNDTYGDQEHSDKEETLTSSGRKSHSESGGGCSNNNSGSSTVSISQSFETVGSSVSRNDFLCVQNSEIRSEPSQTDELDQTDHDSINWEYQLPPPPTDFRDVHSPNCTEFGTVTITPEVFESIDAPLAKIEIEEKLKSSRLSGGNGSSNSEPEIINANQQIIRNSNENNHATHSHHRNNVDSTYSQNKVEVMNELTNIINGNRSAKEKSLSVSNLYINDCKDLKKNTLNYSRSFSIEPIASLDNFKTMEYENKVKNNRKLSASNEIVFSSEITYKNYKNLEKSTSMECIQTNKLDVTYIEKKEDVFRKPVAPVQKKLKIARRSASSIGPNSSNIMKRHTMDDNRGEGWSDDANINVLRQQFLEFLKEKKIMNNDLHMKSLDVIRNILPELKSDKDLSNSSVPVDENSCNESPRTESVTKQKEEKVKVVEMKVKSPVIVDDASFEEVTLRRENKAKPEVKRESLMPPEKKPEISKRYSYQGPPSINFATWGERPKTTRIIIKDEDYVTQEKVTEKKSEMKQNVIHKPVETSPKPKEVKKPAIIIKKPGVLSNYEMFSALPRKKEITSLELVHMEDEEKKKKVERRDSRDFVRAPVVCGVELKKEFKHPSPNRSISFSSPEPETTTEPEADKSRHSVSVYINGNPEAANRDKLSKPSYNFVIPKRNPVVMPVVKGFRSFDESVTTNHVNNGNGSSTTQININIGGGKESEKVEHSFLSQKWSPSKRQSNGVLECPPPPPPPCISSIKLKPVSCVPSKPVSVSQDPRTQLLDEIRNFGGLRKLKKSVAY